MGILANHKYCNAPWIADCIRSWKSLDEEEKVCKFLIMKENRNIGLLILLIALTTLTSAVYFFKRDENRVIVDPSLFKVKDLSRIDGIQLESAKGNVKLHYEGTGWKVNDRYEADRQLITVLFATLEQALAKRPVAASQRDSVNARLNTSGTAVSLFEGQVLQNFLDETGKLPRWNVAF